jgi:hypothetical protein
MLKQTLEGYHKKHTEWFSNLGIPSFASLNVFGCPSLHSLFGGKKKDKNTGKREEKVTTNPQEQLWLQSCLLFYICFFFAFVSS